MNIHTATYRLSHTGQYFHPIPPVPGRGSPYPMLCVQEITRIFPHTAGAMRLQITLAPIAKRGSKLIKLDKNGSYFTPLLFHTRQDGWQKIVAAPVDVAMIAQYPKKQAYLSVTVLTGEDHDTV